MRSHGWISRETYRKEEDFAGLIGGIHVPICESIRRRNGRLGDPPYLFVDLNGGPGRLRDDAGRRFDGSPIIALDALTKSGLPHETIHFENDPAVAAELAAALALDIYPSTTVCEAAFEDGVSRWLSRTPPHLYRYGIVYSDPINTPIPVETFNRVATHFPRVDLLAYVAANNQYKRANSGGYGHGRRLADDIAAVRKTKVLIRTPASAEQYTFILFTNWTQMPAWTSHGFYELKATGPGRAILDDLNWTRKENRERTNTPLPFQPSLSDVPGVPAASAVLSGAGAGVRAGGRHV